MTLPGGQTCVAWLNLPAILITAVITFVLVIGIKESAGFNAAMVFLNIAVILAVVGIGIVVHRSQELAPIPAREKRMAGSCRRSGPDFFRIHRV